MTALSQSRARRFETWKYKTFTLASGNVAYKHGAAFFNPATGKVQVATSSVGTIGLVFLGLFAEDKDATSADKTVTIVFTEEKILERFVNGTSTHAIASTDVGKDAYFLDDQTLTILSAGRTLAGRIWDVDSTNGVAIERRSAEPALLQQLAVASFTSNDYAPAAVIHEGVYDVPTTGAASTITLPAAARNGTRVSFVADGTKNGHTVQYRDETGPTNLTTALTASKRHHVVCVKRDDKWFANAYVSP